MTSASLVFSSSEGAGEKSRLLCPAVEARPDAAPSRRVHAIAARLQLDRLRAVGSRSIGRW